MSRNPKPVAAQIQITLSVIASLRRALEAGDDRTAELDLAELGSIACFESGALRDRAIETIWQTGAEHPRLRVAALDAIRA